MKHILWVSRHAPTPEQTEALSKILGDPTIIITRHENNVLKHEDLIDEFRMGRYDDLVTTLPTEMLGKLCSAGIHPIKAVHEVSGCKPGTNIRTYRFLRFERIHSVKVKKERLHAPEK